MRVIICGAGIAGLSLAICLARNGWDVLIIERSPGPRGEGYMIDFFGSGYDAAEVMGLLPKLNQIRYEVSKLVYLDPNGRPAAWTAYDLFRRLQKDRFMSLLRGDLEGALFDALPKSVEIRFNLTIDKIEKKTSGVAATINNGVLETADLLVGADGIHSRVRQLMFGDEKKFLRYLGFHTAAYLFKDEQILRQLSHDFINLTVPGREVGFYPIRGQRIASFFVHRSKDHTLPHSACAELRRIYNDLAWIVPRALDHCSEAQGVYYDKVAQVQMQRWTAGRTTLIGDACCAVSLLAGQGASIAMGSAYVLAEELANACAVEEALARYEARVRPAIERKQAIGRRMAGWFAPSGAWRISLRNKALNLSHWPALSWILRPVLAGGSESIVRDARSQKLRTFG